MKTVDLTNEEIELILTLLQIRYDNAQRFVRTANRDTATSAYSLAKQNALLCEQLIERLQ